jgi:hypothetical protein
VVQSAVQIVVQSAVQIVVQSAVQIVASIVAGERVGIVVQMVEQVAHLEFNPTPHPPLE